MTSFRAIVTLTVVAAACLLGAVSTASAQPGSQVASHGFSRCPQTPDQYAMVMKQLVADAARARALADQNPLLEPDAAFYEAELADTRRCAPAVASLTGTH
jgi:hypothetical protein